MRVITGTARGRKLVTPEGLEVRPTSDMAKEAIFSSIQYEVENCEMLDLFAGSGQMGVEALSRGARSVTFIDSDPKSIAAVKTNLKNCGFMEKSKVALMDSLSYIKNTTAAFDIAFLDPPYGKEIIDAVLPFVAEKMKPYGVIICETERKEELPKEAGDFEIRKEYRYGKAKVTVYRRKGE